MRTIGVVTSGRSDYGLLRPVLEGIRGEPSLEPAVFVTGMHLEPRFGETLREIEADGFPIVERVPMLESSDEPEGIATSIGRGVAGFGAAYVRSRPDLLLVLGDRFEIHAAVTAALPFRVPVAHIHGGESTEGLIDEAIRHSITKMSHLHFAATDLAARRIVQMGEEPWRVTVSGAPGLDAIAAVGELGDDELRSRYGVELSGPTLLVTYHPVTLEYERAEEQVRALLTALEASGLALVITAPNADTRGGTVSHLLEEFVSARAGATLVTSLGTAAYVALMRRVAAMVGNSSSGIIEAASFRLPVVDVGSRQRGRERPRNVIDVGYGSDEILAGIERALSAEFVASLQGLENPYGDGHAAERIVAQLRDVPLDDRLVFKHFHDLGS